CRVRRQEGHVFPPVSRRIQGVGSCRLLFQTIPVTGPPFLEPRRRTVFVHKLPPMLLALVVCCAPFARADDSIPLNEEYKGKTKAEKVKNYQTLTSDAVAVDLKSGQRIELSVKIVGDNRGAAIILWNSDGEAVAFSAPLRAGAIGGQPAKLTEGNLGDAQHQVVMSPKTARILISEVPATATYTIKVYSEVAGDYILLARDATRKRDVATIQKELKAAKDRVADLEKELAEAERPKKDK